MFNKSFKEFLLILYLFEKLFLRKCTIHTICLKKIYVCTLVGLLYKNNILQMLQVSDSYE